jgi:hypothetical protein
MAREKPLDSAVGQAGLAASEECDLFQFGTMIGEPRRLGRMQAGEHHSQAFDVARHQSAPVQMFAGPAAPVAQPIGQLLASDR